jgi:ribosomal protein L32
MGLPGHRRTSSHKRRRASHFALVKTPLVTDKAGVIHRPHRAAPGAMEYNGIAIHVKGRERKLQKALSKTKSKTVADTHAGHDHADHEGHDHAGHTHA